MNDKNNWCKTDFHLFSCSFQFKKHCLRLSHIWSSFCSLLLIYSVKFRLWFHDIIYLLVIMFWKSFSPVYSRFRSQTFILYCFATSELTLPCFQSVYERSSSCPMNQFSCFKHEKNNDGKTYVRALRLFASCEEASASSSPRKKKFSINVQKGKRTSTDWGRRS